MLRVVERVLGEGDVHRGGACVARTGYELSLYRQWVDKDGQLEPRHFEVEGHLIAPPEVLEPLLGTSAPSRCTSTRSEPSMCTCSMPTAPSRAPTTAASTRGPESNTRGTPGVRS